MGGASHNRIRAILSPFARFAVFPHPHFIKLVHGLFDDLWVVGQDSGFEVACCFSFHSDAGACEVGATHVNLFAVEYEHLEVDSWTEHSLQSVVQHGVFIKVLTKVRSRLFRMDKPHLHASADELSNKCQKRFLLTAHLHIEVLDIGGANPKRVLHGLDP